MSYIFPDVSVFRPIGNYDTFCNAYPIASCRGTAGTTYVDPVGQTFKAALWARGAVPILYHFLHNADIQAQADWFVRWCWTGRQGPVGIMLDLEAADVTVAQGNAWLDAVAAATGVPTSQMLNYLPRWWWTPKGGTARSSVLVASAYTNTPNLSPYAGLTPQIWQFTDAGPIAGAAPTTTGDLNNCLGKDAAWLRATVLGDPTGVNDLGTFDGFAGTGKSTFENAVAEAVK